MKVIGRHIQLFEQFIKNSKDPNKEKQEKENTKKRNFPESEDDEINDKSKDKDMVDELEEYFEKRKNNLGI